MVSHGGHEVRSITRLRRLGDDCADEDFFFSEVRLTRVSNCVVDADVLQFVCVGTERTMCARGNVAGPVSGVDVGRNELSNPSADGAMRSWD